jgi:hypothetical protein
MGRAARGSNEFSSACGSAWRRSIAALPGGQKDATSTVRLKLRGRISLLSPFALASRMHRGCVGDAVADEVWERLRYHEADAGVKRACNVCHSRQFQPRRTAASTSLLWKKANVRHFIVIVRRISRCHQESSSIRKCPDDRKTSRALQCQLSLIGTLHVCTPVIISHVQTRRSYRTPLPPAPTADTTSLKLDASPGCVGRSSSDDRDYRIVCYLQTYRRVHFAFPINEAPGHVKRVQCFMAQPHVQRRALSSSLAQRCLTRHLGQIGVPLQARFSQIVCVMVVALDNVTVKAGS